jgi:hypothetical protein
VTFLHASQLRMPISSTFLFVSSQEMRRPWTVWTIFMTYSVYVYMTKMDERHS